MNNQILVMACVCIFGCATTPPVAPNTTNRVVVNSVAPSDDIKWIVNPAWHPAKEFKIEQSLHANPVVKDHLPAPDAPIEHQPLNK